MAEKKELNLEEAGEVSGGMNPSSVSPEEWKEIINGSDKYRIGSVQIKPEISTNQGTEIAPNQNDPRQVENGPGGVLNQNKTDKKDVKLDGIF